MARKPKLKEGEKVLRLLDWIGLVLRVYVKVYNGYDIMNIHEFMISWIIRVQKFSSSPTCLDRRSRCNHTNSNQLHPPFGCRPLNSKSWCSLCGRPGTFKIHVLEGRLRWKLWTSKMLPNVHFGYLAAFCCWWLWSRKMNRRSVHLGYKATQIFGNLDNLAKSPNLRGWNASSSYVLQDLWTSVSVSLVSLAFLVFEDPTGSLTRSESIRIKAAWHRFSARWKKKRNSIAV